MLLVDVGIAIREIIVSLHIDLIVKAFPCIDPRNAGKMVLVVSRLSRRGYMPSPSKLDHSRLVTTRIYGLTAWFHIGKL